MRELDKRKPLRSAVTETPSYTQKCANKYHQTGLLKRLVGADNFGKIWSAGWQLEIQGTQ
jgi:hypothetical protein